MATDMCFKGQKRDSCASAVLQQEGLQMQCRLHLRTKGFQPFASSPTQTVLSSQLLLEVTRNKSSPAPHSALVVPRICIPPSAGGVFFKTYKWHLRAKPGAAHHLFHAFQKCNVFIAPTSLPIPLLLWRSHPAVVRSRKTEGTHESWVQPLLVIWPCGHE